MQKTRLIAAATIIAVAMCGSAFAQTIESPPPFSTPVTCPQIADADIEATDQQLLARALEDFNRGGFAGLRRHLEPMRAAMARAPGCYPMIERRGDTILLREVEAPNEVMLTVLMTAAVTGQETSVDHVENTYGVVALLLGSFAVQTRQYEEAITWLDQGLARQPDNTLLIGEKGMALSALRRFQEAYDLYQSALNNTALTFTLDRPTFMRRSAIVLIDLERLDEAEALLNEVLTLKPDDQIAQHELQYIARLRAGGAAADMQLIAPNAPASKPPI